MGVRSRRQNGSSNFRPDYSSLMIEVLLPDGRLVGDGRPDGSQAFLGVRYATVARFQTAEAEIPWSGTREARTHGPICHQEPGLIESAMGGSLPPMGEDCLSLSVHTPGDGRTGLPVLVWIHGGGFVNGSGSSPWYDGAALARRGVVVVSINYRLGVFGFWRGNNVGIGDQIEALRWVRRNAEGFGGDPDNVTIFGESAGGSSVVALMASPDARGLFHRVWSMSPSIGQYRSQERADMHADRFLELAGVDDDEQLRTKSAEEMLDAQKKLMSGSSRAYDFFSPTAGGKHLPGDIVDTAATSDSSLVVGTTRDENRLFGAFTPEAQNMTSETMRSMISTLLPGCPEAVEVYRDHRPGENDAQIVMAVQSDEGFRQRAVRLAEKHASNGGRSHMYWFTWPTPAFGGVLGSCHAIDIPFTFDNLDSPGISMFTGDAPERTLIARDVSTQLVSFATSGEVDWPRFCVDRRATRVFDLEATVLHDPEPRIRALWESARPDL
jgi:para-nitrobenzyl esterase